MHVASDSDASQAVCASDTNFTTDFASDGDYASDTVEGATDDGEEYVKLAEATDEREKLLSRTEGQQSTQRQCANYGKHLLSKGVLRHHVSISPPSVLKRISPSDMQSIGLLADSHAFRLNFYGHTEIIESHVRIFRVPTTLFLFSTAAYSRFLAAYQLDYTG